ncbi:serine/threonine protein kinase 6 [Plasmodium ovale curtisi]|uniref:Aurora kinase n=1 Tax=Plasmodium ovale curtisi TaxID=864141 RepID=A0A1A8WCN3_PLAOA|nr:serine/threonine protein kinase 6 [Plasmodium ovale curtisi]
MNENVKGNNYERAEDIQKRKKTTSEIVYGVFKAKTFIKPKQREVKSHSEQKMKVSYESSVSSKSHGNKPKRSIPQRSIPGRGIPQGNKRQGDIFAEQGVKDLKRKMTNLVDKKENMQGVFHKSELNSFPKYAQTAFAKDESTERDIMNCVSVRGNKDLSTNMKIDKEKNYFTTNGDHYNNMDHTEKDSERLNNEYNICEKKNEKLQNRLNSSTSKDAFPLNHNAAKHKDDIHIRRNNTSLDAFHKRKRERDEHVDNEKKKPTYSYNKEDYYSAANMYTHTNDVSMHLALNQRRGSNENIAQTGISRIDCMSKTSIIGGTKGEGIMLNDSMRSVFLTEKEKCPYNNNAPGSHHDDNTMCEKSTDVIKNSNIYAKSSGFYPEHDEEKKKKNSDLGHIKCRKTYLYKNIPRSENKIVHFNRNPSGENKSKGEIAITNSMEEENSIIGDTTIESKRKCSNYQSKEQIEGIISNNVKDKSHRVNSTEKKDIYFECKTANTSDSNIKEAELYFPVPSFDEIKKRGSYHTYENYSKSNKMYAHDREDILSRNTEEEGKKDVSARIENSHDNNMKKGDKSFGVNRQKNGDVDDRKVLSEDVFVEISQSATHDKEEEIRFRHCDIFNEIMNKYTGKIVGEIDEKKEFKHGEEATINQADVQEDKTERMLYQTGAQTRKEAVRHAGKIAQREKSNPLSVDTKCSSLRENKGNFQMGNKRFAAPTLSSNRRSIVLKKKILDQIKTEKRDLSENYRRRILYSHKINGISRADTHSDKTNNRIVIHGKSEQCTNHSRIVLEKNNPSINTVISSSKKVNVSNSHTNSQSTASNSVERSLYNRHYNDLIEKHIYSEHFDVNNNIAMQSSLQCKDTPYRGDKNINFVPNMCYAGGDVKTIKWEGKKLKSECESGKKEEVETNQVDQVEGENQINTNTLGEGNKPMSVGEENGEALSEEAPEGREMMAPLEEVAPKVHRSQVIRSGIKSSGIRSGLKSNIRNGVKSSIRRGVRSGIGQHKKGDSSITMSSNSTLSVKSDVQAKGKTNGDDLKCAPTWRATKVNREKGNVICDTMERVERNSTKRKDPCNNSSSRTRLLGVKSKVCITSMGKQSNKKKEDNTHDQKVSNEKGRTNTKIGTTNEGNKTERYIGGKGEGVLSEKANTTEGKKNDTKLNKCKKRAHYFGNPHNTKTNCGDVINEEMEKYKSSMKKKKMKSNSIPPESVKRGNVSQARKGIHKRFDGSGREKEMESDQAVYVTQNSSSDGRKGPGKETTSSISEREDTSSSLSNNEKKEMSYFEWLAMEKKKREEVGNAEGDIVSKTVDGSEKKRMKEEILKDDEKQTMLHPLLAFNLKQNERIYEQDDFVVDKHPIGNGRTGLVFRAIIKKENEKVALKVMAKDTISTLNIERQVLKEIIIQASLNHINILELIAYFEDRTRLFLILELANGGSIRSKMKLKDKPLEEEQVALYVYQIADALSYLHNFNIIHRDLKPDNILIHYSHDHDQNKIYKYGIIKLADFGFSCQLKNRRQKRSTFCGTVDYMPPEIINQVPYDCNVDLWCLGIVIFELLVGFPPFTDDTQERIFDQIKGLNFHFPKSFPLQARELILKLCSKTAEERISAAEVKVHPWGYINMYVAKEEKREEKRIKGKLNCLKNKTLHGEIEHHVTNRDFNKDIEELDLNGLEDDIASSCSASASLAGLKRNRKRKRKPTLAKLSSAATDIETVPYKDAYMHVSQITIFVRIDGEYHNYTKNSELMKLGDKFMTMLHNAMINVQLRKSGKGIFTCYYENKDIKEDLATYFLNQEEVDFIKVDFEDRFPGKRKRPFMGTNMRYTNESLNMDEL